MQSIRIIKKYPNRRLYDTSLGAYITLNDVKKLVFDHIDFCVLDARTKKDITQSTLMQIISEQEATHTPLFTTAILQDLIRFYHEKSQHLFSQYLQQVMSAFLQQKDYFRQQWDSYQKLFIDPSLMEQTLKMQKMWTGMMGNLPKKKTKMKPKKTR